MRRLEIRHLKTFKTIVEVGGFTRAAEHLGYSQSTVTLHIKAIEDELKEPLFNRMGKKVFLTDTGKHLMPYATQMLSLYKQIKDVPSINGEISGRVVISAPEVLLTYRLPPIMKVFKDTFPKVDVQLKHLPAGNLKEQIISEEIDIAFVLDTEHAETDINVKCITEEPMVLITPTHYPTAFDAIPFHDTVFLFTEQGCSYRNAFEKIVRMNNIKIENHIEFWSIEAIKQSVICGLGISLLPYIAVKHEIENGMLSAIKMSPDTPLFTFIAHHKDKWISPAVRNCLEIIEEHIGSSNMYSEDEYAI
ncbi:LysR family transcriptional regulator [Aneurinibacillus migulanus]|uniref:LysR family transcriptional regulator n=1 Tax=Aneurinibacillus migulanus TaxID=47500 RepID=UPI00209CF9F6|nr:LysR family transcriptional regulator [Aneurinibacillus migulanus]